VHVPMSRDSIKWLVSMRYRCCKETRGRGKRTVSRPNCRNEPTSSQQTGQAHGDGKHGSACRTRASNEQKTRCGGSRTGTKQPDRLGQSRQTSLDSYLVCLAVHAAQRVIAVRVEKRRELDACRHDNTNRNKNWLATAIVSNESTTPLGLRHVSTNTEGQHKPRAARDNRKTHRCRRAHWQ
jgi:hypothetical protein